MKSVLTIMLCLLFANTVMADSARVFDTYGDLPFSDEKTRLDNLSYYLKEQPNSDVWYYVFAGTDSCAGEARRRAIRAKSYLIERHGIQADRIKWADEGYREHLLFELWLWPRTLSRPISNNTSLDKSEAPVLRNCKSKNHKRQRRIKQ